MCDCFLLIQSSCEYTYLHGDTKADNHNGDDTGGVSAEEPCQLADV